MKVLFKKKKKKKRKLDWFVAAIQTYAHDNIIPFLAFLAFFVLVTVFDIWIWHGYAHACTKQHGMITNSAPESCVRPDAIIQP